MLFKSFPIHIQDQAGSFRSVRRKISMLRSNQLVSRQVKMSWTISMRSWVCWSCSSIGFIFWSFLALMFRFLSISKNCSLMDFSVCFFHLHWWRGRIPPKLHRQAPSGWPFRLHWRAYPLWKLKGLLTKLRRRCSPRNVSLDSITGSIGQHSLQQLRFALRK